MCKGLAALPQSCLERAKEIKTKLGLLLQKPEAAVDLVAPCSEKPAKTQKPSLEEAVQWRESLDKLLQNNYGLASFKSFLRSEFSEENLDFWMACEDYKKTKSPAKMAEKAQKIYEEFIQSEAPKERHALPERLPFHVLKWLGVTGFMADSCMCGMSSSLFVNTARFEEAPAPSHHS
ncbi:regulator of G-protein signaling 5 [Pteropus vampyrus]|uniref:Regulator of G-protein signaling 5 n=1 Tax=Pteropus vampyrus TaxID=132908 RepID=A0A6P3R6J5_PTEVA|nr:regulator of G-protein signaling 5 [Pteropus vampyrus]